MQLVETFPCSRQEAYGHAARPADTGEVQELKQEVRDTREPVADLALEDRLLEKGMIGDGETNDNVADTPYLVSEVSGCDGVGPAHKPRLLGDGGSSCQVSRVLR